MNKYFDGGVIFTSICSIGLATISIAEGKIYEPPNNIVKNIQLQRLDNSLAVNIKNLETFDHQRVINTTNTINSTPKTKTPSVPAAAINLIKEFEGFESEAYIDTDGTPVIGYGLSRIAGKPVQIGDRILPEQADAALKTQLLEIQQHLDKTVKVKLSDRQLSALASLSYNVGVGFIENSTLLRKLNAGDYAGAANEFLRWDKANVSGRLVQLPGLTRRRQAERELFLHQNS